MSDRNFLTQIPKRNLRNVNIIAISYRNDTQHHVLTNQLYALQGRPMTHLSDAKIACQIVDLCRWISEGSIPRIEMGMSLTHDLHFDSLKLMQFFSGIEDLYAGLALEDWFIEHASGGRDTIGNVVRYIAHALPLATVRSSYGPPRNTGPCDRIDPARCRSSLEFQSPYSLEDAARPAPHRFSACAETLNDNMPGKSLHGAKPGGDRLSHGIDERSD